MIERSVKAFVKHQIPFLNMYPAMIRMAVLVMTCSSPRGPRVSFGVLGTPQPVLSGRSCERTSRSVWPPQSCLGIHLRCLCPISGRFLKLCSRSFSNAVGLKDEIDTLSSRVVMLEKLFEDPASDEKETAHRDGLIMYATGLRSGWILKICQ